MVIAKPEWFKRKNGSFLSSRITWQGAIYIIVTISVIFIGMTLPQNIITEIIVAAVFLFLLMDANVATLKSLDEREKMHYSIAMRNMAWGIIIAIIIVSIILSYYEVKNSLNILIVVIILVGGLINFITKYRLQKEN